jgi:hypothetical protein
LEHKNIWNKGEMKTGQKKRQKRGKGNKGKIILTEKEEGNIKA